MADQIPLRVKRGEFHDYDNPRFLLQIRNANLGLSTVVVAIGMWFAFVVLSIAALWRMFRKAGQPGWAALIPIYNFYILLKIGGRPGWWLLLALIPVVNFGILMLLSIDIAKAFGRSAEFGVFLLGMLGIGYLILGFGNSRYRHAPTGAACF